MRSFRRYSQLLCAAGISDETTAIWLDRAVGATKYGLLVALILVEGVMEEVQSFVGVGELFAVLIRIVLDLHHTMESRKHHLGDWYEKTTFSAMDMVVTAHTVALMIPVVLAAFTIIATVLSRGSSDDDIDNDDFFTFAPLERGESLVTIVAGVLLIFTSLASLALGGLTSEIMSRVVRVNMDRKGIQWWWWDDDNALWKNSDGATSHTLTRELLDAHEDPQNPTQIVRSGWARLCCCWGLRAKDRVLLFPLWFLFTTVYALILAFILVLVSPVAACAIEPSCTNGPKGQNPLPEAEYMLSRSLRRIGLFHEMTEFFLDLFIVAGKTSGTSLYLAVPALALSFGELAMTCWAHVFQKHSTTLVGGRLYLEPGVSLADDCVKGQRGNHSALVAVVGSNGRGVRELEQQLVGHEYYVPGAWGTGEEDDAMTANLPFGGSSVGNTPPVSLLEDTETKSDCEEPVNTTEEVNNNNMEAVASSRDPPGAYFQENDGDGGDSEGVQQDDESGVRSDLGGDEELASTKRSKLGPNDTRRLIPVELVFQSGKADGGIVTGVVAFGYYDRSGTWGWRGTKEWRLTVEFSFGERTFGMFGGIVSEDDEDNNERAVRLDRHPDWPVH